MKLVVVESPAKAKTINKYLGSNYQVEASFGHVCDLPSKNGSVDVENNFEMKYEISPRSQAHIKKLCEIAKKSDEIILATDPDREGEAISWHVIRVLKEKKAITKDTKISRVAFNEITKKAVNNAIANPREVDQNLVDAQQARRALDYLVGFNLSPVLWKKLPGAKSAGRVQSVALRLICEREAEIESFKTQEYWDIHANFLTNSNKELSAKLIISNGQKLEKFSIPNETEAEKIENALKKIASYQVTSIEKKLQKRTPPPPFTTSTIQQEASRKLGFTTKKTMQLAQKLYEGIEIGSETAGLITYMRTDGIYISEDAIVEARDYIGGTFGKDYVPETARKYKSKIKNAQEAHEAIRPTNITRTPVSLEGILEKDLLKLYDLIWKRTLASQMENAELELVAIQISSDNGAFIFKANGSIIKFDGFFKLYQEGKDDEAEDEENTKILPKVEEKEKLTANNITPKQHFTEPPPRYNEASLVKKLEELGIGRPSTYAAIISVIQEREYVKLDKKRFTPEERGRLVTAFLVEFFAKYVEYDFTAQLEEDLDKVADGEMPWKNLMGSFWEGFYKNIEKANSTSITEVIETLDKVLEEHLFPRKDDKDPRKCPACENGRLGLRIGKFGAFISCSNYPTCNHRKSVQNIESESNGSDEIIEENNNKNLGILEEKQVYFKKGPYGYYVQLGEDSKTDKPKRASLPPFIKPEEIDLEKATSLLSLPKSLGASPEGLEVSMGIGKFGPYIKCDNKFTSIPKSEDPFSVNLTRALEIIKETVKLPKNNKR